MNIITKSKESREAVKVAIKWMQVNRPNLKPYLKETTGGAAQRPGKEDYFVTLMVNSQKGYKKLTFLVTINPNSVVFLEEKA